MITSRGCPGICVFCSIHSVWGYKWRARTPENVVSEIEKLVNEYKIREIHFEDDNLTLSKLRMAKICDLIIERGIDISWTTPNGVAVQKLDLDLLRKMKKSGCYQLSFGIESGDPYVLRNIIHKPISLDKVRRVVNWSKNLGIWAHGYFVIGFPGEPSKSIQRTITFAKETDLDSASFFIATPYPGTPLYKSASSKGLLKNGFDLAKLRTMDATIDTEYFKAKELTEIQKRAYLEFMKYRLKREIVNGYIIIRFFKIRSLNDIAFWIQKVRRLIQVFR
jgi:magnesium-protoporphyrin IX monomethyl ester (oxidative) cyclase